MKISTKTSTKILLLTLSLILSLSCDHKNIESGNIIKLNVDEIDSFSTKLVKADTVGVPIDYGEEENGNDEFISKFLFEKWKGRYQIKQSDQIDGWGRESIAVSELILIKPDSCIFKTWLTDERGIRYAEDDNYQEFIGGILATKSKDSIEFYTKKVVVGGNNNLSPLLSVSRSGNNFSIYSLITSPPNNGIIPMPLIKMK